MKRWLGLVGGAAVIIALTTGAGTHRAYAQNNGKAQAQKAAEAWLALVDAGQYGASYDQAAQSFKAVVSRDEWIKDVTGARGPLGKMSTRRLAKSDVMRDPPNAPPGEYVAIQYQSSFANLNAALETVVPVLEKDGKWRVSGYYVKKAQ